MLSEEKLTADVACVEDFEVVRPMLLIYLRYMSDIIFRSNRDEVLTAGLMQSFDRVPTCRASGPSAEIKRDTQVCRTTQGRLSLGHTAAATAVLCTALR